MSIARIMGIIVAGIGCATSVVAAEPAGLPHPVLPIERHLTLSPHEGNPRNSEGDFVRLKSGHWLFIYTHFTSGSADHAKAMLCSRESADDGRTWTKEDKVVVANEGGMNVMSVSLLRLQSGGIALFYLRKNSLRDCRPVLRISKDEGQTWSAPVDCVTDEVGYYILNNSRVIQLPGGRLIMPLALHPNRDGKLHDGKIVPYLSDDDGKTWRRSASMLATDKAGKRISFMEPGVVAINDTQLLMTIRTRVGCQYFSESKDAGETWSTPTESKVFSPESPATIVKIPESDHLLMVWNDLCQQPITVRTNRPPLRDPLVAAISTDSGKTWHGEKVIEGEPKHGYCYTAIAFAGERVLLGYCANASPYGLETTQISSFKLKDLDK